MARAANRRHPFRVRRAVDAGPGLARHVRIAFAPSWHGPGYCSRRHAYACTHLYCHGFGFDGKAKQRPNIFVLICYHKHSLTGRLVASVTDATTAFFCAGWCTTSAVSEDQKLVINGGIRQWVTLIGAVSVRAVASAAALETGSAPAAAPASQQQKQVRTAEEWLQRLHPLRAVRSVLSIDIVKKRNTNHTAFPDNTRFSGTRFIPR
jgi:hypothetical protein